MIRKARLRRHHAYCHVINSSARVQATAALACVASNEMMSENKSPLAASGMRLQQLRHGRARTIVLLARLAPLASGWRRRRRHKNTGRRGNNVVARTLQLSKGTTAAKSHLQPYVSSGQGSERRHWWTLEPGHRLSSTWPPRHCRAQNAAGPLQHDPPPPLLYKKTTVDNTRGMFLPGQARGNQARAADRLGMRAGLPWPG